jgi:hypothetical protein
MKSFVVIALLTAAALPAQAADLKPLEAGTFALGSHAVSIVYTALDGIYEVTTTIAGPDGPVRFVGFLERGQKALISAGEFGTAAPPEVLELVWQEGVLSVLEGTAVATAQ